jgi:hypothetical protein
VAAPRGEVRFTSARAERPPPGRRSRGEATAHLRLRGEVRCQCATSRRYSGSPPLARRGRCLEQRAQPLCRLTSAHAERATGPGSVRDHRPVHLRSREEDASRHAKQARDDGLTSARAERTPAAGRRRPGTSADLRSRGEDCNGACPDCPYDGSPPLARRGLVRLGLGQAGERLTSARADGTRRRSLPTAGSSAHLRSRGEDCRIGSNGNRACGSPPLAQRRRRPHDPHRHQY